MKSAEIQALRIESDRAQDDYMDAQARLLVRIEAASVASATWPAPADYLHVAGLGRRAAEALRRYLNCVGVPRFAQRSASERKKLIEQASRNERLWQPTPDAWLQQQDLPPRG